MDTGNGDGQENLVCCSPWGRKKSNMTEQLNWTEESIWTKENGIQCLVWKYKVPKLR